MLWRMCDRMRLIILHLEVRTSYPDPYAIVKQKNLGVSHWVQLLAPLRCQRVRLKYYSVLRSSAHYVDHWAHGDGCEDVGTVILPPHIRAQHSTEKTL